MHWLCTEDAEKKKDLWQHQHRIKKFVHKFFLADCACLTTSEGRIFFIVNQVVVDVQFTPPITYYMCVLWWQTEFFLSKNISLHFEAGCITSDVKIRNVVGSAGAQK